MNQERFETKEEFNKRIFIESIKTGKIPSRKALGTRLLLLSEYKYSELHYSANYKKISNKQDKNFLKRNGVSDFSDYKLLTFQRSQKFLSEYRKDIMLNPKYKTHLLKNINKYLGENYITWDTRVLKIFYKQDPDWYYLDLDYLKIYPNRLDHTKILEKNL